MLLHKLKQDEGITLETPGKVADKLVPLPIVDKPQHLVTIGMLAHRASILLPILKKYRINLEVGKNLLVDQFLRRGHMIGRTK